MKLKKTIVISLSVIVLLGVFYFLFLWHVGKAYESIGESLNVPVKSIKTLSLGKDEYTLYYSPGAAFTSREWFVKKNGRLIYHISGQDGQIEDLKMKHGKPYLVGSGVDNVDLLREDYK